MENNIKALVADDDQTHREIFSDLMGEEGMDVDAVEDGEKAISLINEMDYDVILTDLMMPGSDGMTVLRAARKKKKNTMVIIITGFGTLETAIEAIRNGAHDYITKPFKLEELQLVLKNVKEKIILVRSNRELKERLEEVLQEVDLLKRERQDGLQQLEEANERLNDYEHNLSAILSRFPFLLNHTPPLTLLESNKKEENSEE